MPLARSRTCAHRRPIISKRSPAPGRASTASGSTTNGEFASCGPPTVRPRSRSWTITEEAPMTPKRITTHPGEIIAEEFLKPLSLSVNALAIALRVPATRVGAIVKGERAVTADTAMRLARYFLTTPEFWMNLQAMHDLTKAQAEAGEAI